MSKATFRGKIYDNFLATIGATPVVRLGKLARQRDKAAAKCDKGDGDACQEAEAIDAEIEAEQDRPV